MPVKHLLLFWYSKQTVCVKWGRCISDYFSISNGVRQGRIMSPKFFSVCVDDLSDKLVKSKVGCSKDNLGMNHVIYADDVCVMAPSPADLQELINICYDFGVQNYSSFNSSQVLHLVLARRMKTIYFVNSECYAQSLTDYYVYSIIALLMKR